METQEDVLVDISLSDVCPICLENQGLTQLSCSHYIHLECAKGMTDALCPLCRSSIEKDLSSEVLSSIEDSAQQYQANLEIEDRERLGAQVINPGSIVTLFVRPRPHIEVLSAINYLRRQKIPLEFLPQRIQIKKPRGHPEMKPGAIFSLLVGQALAQMQVAIGSSASESDSESDSEDPYSTSNQEIEQQMINLLNARERVDITDDSSPE